MDDKISRSTRSKMWILGLLLIFVYGIGVPFAKADPMYNSPSWGHRRRVFPPSNQQEQRLGRPPSAYNQRRTAAVSQTSYRRQPAPSFRRATDYSSKVLDVEEFKRDKKARLWQANLKTRNLGKTSWTTRIIMANVFCYLLQTWNPKVTQMGVKLSDKILKGEQLYRLLTPVFLHGGIAHLGMNMYSLNRIGPDVEKLFGPGRYLMTYLGAGIAGNMLSAINSPNPALGASGAVFGVVGAQLVFLARNDWLLGQQGQRMQSAIFQTMGLNLVLGMMNPMIDNWGHLGGVIGGAAAAYYFGPRLHLMNLPGGGRLLVDSPVVRLPRYIESIPEKVGKRFDRMTRRMQINQHTSDLPNKPWRSPQRQQQRQRQAAPNRSIKPKRF